MNRIYIKKNVTRIFIVALVVLIGTNLISCGQRETMRNDENRFQETKINLPDEIGAAFDLCETENGLLLSAFDEAGNTGRLWITENDGETWTKLSTFTDLLDIDKSKESSQNQRDTSAYLSKTGEIFFVSQNWIDEDTVVEECYLISGDKVHKLPIELPLENKKGNAIYHAIFSDKGELVAEDIWGQIYRIDKETGSIVQSYLPEDTTLLVNDFTLAGDTLYVLTNNDVFMYSVQDGVPKEKDATMRKIASEMGADEGFERIAQRKIKVTHTDAEPEITYIDTSGIFRFSTDGSSEKLIDGSDTCLYGGDVALYDFEKTKDDKLFLLVSDEVGSSLYRYEKMDENAKEAAEGKMELTLYTLKENDDFAALIKLYRQTNPDVKITVTTGITEEQDIPVSDALRILNADILSGHGPDIICFDNMDISAFSEAGLLADLSQSIKKVEQSENLFTNILNAYKNDDGLYVIPTKFSFACVVGLDEVVDVRGDLAAFNAKLAQIYEKNNSKPLLNAQFFDKIVRVYYQTWIATATEENGNASSSQLKTFYEGIKLLHDISGGQDIWRKDPRATNKGLIPYSYQESFDLMTGLSQLSIQDVMGVQDIQALYTIKKMKGLSYGLLTPNKMHLFAGQNVVGINSKSEHQDEAQQFLMFLLSKDAQSCARPPAWENGFPVNKDVLSKQFEQAESSGPTITTGQGEDIHIKYDELTSTDVTDIFTALADLKTPTQNDLILYEIITESLGKYLNGKISLNEIVNAVKNKLDIYAKE
jgi:ABC-type glycerol-3-phosphate transport system substrate-binding protein